MDTTQAPLLITAAAVLLILLLLFAGFAIIIIRFQRQTYTIRSKAFLSELKTLEKERTRIARDLHDELSPLLTRVFMHVDICSMRYGAAVAGFLAPSKETLEQAIDRVGEIIRNLDDERMLQSGLQESILKILEQYRDLQQLQYTFKYTIKKELSRDITIGLYRILLELIQNTQKHAHASAIKVQIWEWRNFLFLSYKDNGTRTLPVNQDGIGLKSLQHRIELLGGICEPQLQSGHCFQFHIPLKSAYNGT